MQKKKLKYQDFRRTLGRTNVLLWPALDCREGIFLIRKERINKEKITQGLLSGDVRAFTSRSVKDWRLFLGIQETDIQKLTASSITALSRKVKELEWWGKRRAVADVLPAEFLVKGELDPSILAIRVNRLEAFKHWLKKKECSQPVSRQDVFLLDEAFWSPIERRLHGVSFPGACVSLIRFLLWFRGKDGFPGLVALFHNAFLSFRENITESNQKDEEEALNSLGYLLGKPFATKKRFTPTTALKEIKNKLDKLPIWHKSEYFQKRVKTQVPAVQEIQFEGWDDLPFSKDAANKLLFCLKAHFREKFEKRITFLSPYLHFLSCFFLKEDIDALPVDSCRLYLALCERARFEDKLDTFVCTLNTLSDPSEHFQYMEFLCHRPHIGTLSSYKNHVSFIQKGITTRTIQEFYELEYEDELEEFVKNIRAIPCFLKVARIARDLSKQTGKKEVLGYEQIRAITRLNPASASMIESFSDHIRSMMESVATLDSGNLTVLFQSLLDCILTGMEAKDLRPFHEWLNPRLLHRPPEEVKNSFVYSASEKEIRELLYYRSLCGEEGLPKKLLNILYQEEKLKKEIQYLQNEDFKDEKHKKRLENLLGYRESFKEYLKKEFKKKLSHSLVSYKLQSLKKIITDYHSVRFYALFPEGKGKISHLPLDTLLKCTQFFTRVRENKDLLESLLRAYFTDPEGYRQFSPRNQQWVKRANKRGVAVEQWLNYSSEKYTHKGKTVEVYAEHDPFEIFMMGTYFNTCLSIPGGLNPESVIINAADINKKVLYARDDSKRVIGRKLLGVTTGFKIIGFHSYGGAELKQFFQDYCVKLSEKCRMPLTNVGPAEKLHPGHWYDDGPEMFTVESLKRIEQAIADEPVTDFPDFPYHRGFLRYYVQNKGRFSSFLKTLGLSPEDVPLETLPRTNPELFAEVCVHVAGEEADKDFLAFSMDHAPSKITGDVLFLYSVHERDEAIPLLRSHIVNGTDYNEIAMAALRFLKSERALDTLAELSARYNVSWAFEEAVRAPSLQNKITVSLRGLPLDEDAHYGFRWEFLLFESPLVWKNLFWLMEKYFDKKPEAIDYWENPNFERNLFMLDTPARFEASLKDVLKLLDKHTGLARFILPFLFFNYGDLSKQFFRDRILDGWRDENEWAALYLSIHAGGQYAKSIADLCLIDPGNHAFFSALVLSGQEKFTHLIVRLLKEKGLWDAYHEEIVSLPEARKDLNKLWLYFLSMGKDFMSRNIKLSSVVAYEIIRIINEQGLAIENVEVLREIFRVEGEHPLKPPIIYYLFRLFNKQNSDEVRRTLLELFMLYTSHTQPAWNERELTSLFLARYLKDKSVEEWHRVFSFSASNECPLIADEIIISKGQGEMLISAIESWKKLQSVKRARDADLRIVSDFSAYSLINSLPFYVFAGHIQVCDDGEKLKSVVQDALGLRKVLAEKRLKNLAG